MLKPGAGVTTTRAHVHYVVTEYGVAMLYGSSLRQRPKRSTSRIRITAMRSRNKRTSALAC